MGLTSWAHANTILSFGDAQSLGSLIPGSPADPSDEAGYITNLVGLAAPSTGVVIGSHTYDRTSNNGFGVLPAATDVGSVTVVTPPGSASGIDVTGFLYLLGKYGDGVIPGGPSPKADAEPNGGDYVWYVGNLSGLVDIPSDSSTWPGHGHQGLSHWALFNPSTTHVPDGGVTVLLLGAGLCALTLIRRKLGSS